MITFLEFLAALMIFIRVACLAKKTDRHDWEGRIFRFIGWVLVFSLFGAAAIGTLFEILTGALSASGQHADGIMARVLLFGVCLHMILDYRPPMGTPPAVWKQVLEFFGGGQNDHTSR